MIAVVPRVLSDPAEHPALAAPTPPLPTSAALPELRMGLQAALGTLGVVVLNDAIGLEQSAARSAERHRQRLCRFSGSTDCAGHVAVTTDVTAEGDNTIVDVAAAFDSKAISPFGVHYLLEELSIWRGEQLENVAVNSRYLLGHRIVRQQWDEFRRATGGMQGERVHAKTLADFRRRHPGFVQHWDPASFGQPWLRDYPSAPPERRIDLDLRASPLPPTLRSPLALASYWVRWLPRALQDVPVFLPSFKAEHLVEVPVAPTLLPPALSGARCCTTRLSASGSRRPPRRWFRPTNT